jgi:REP element-mobilizing transposase RayT
MSDEAINRDVVGRVPPRGVPEEPPPRRLRRLHRVWPDRDGNISYLLTICVDGRGRVLDNETTFERFAAFLLDSPTRYRWFGRRFVVMPDHIHLIAHMGHESVRLGQWIKALKAVVGGLERRGERPVGTPGLQPPDAASGDAAYNNPPADVSRVPPHGGHEFTRIKRAWRWQDGFHDHKFRTPESEARKWEYVCLNPVRAGLVKRPEEWPFGGEIFYDDAGRPRLVRGTPPLLEAGMLIEEDDGRTAPREGRGTPREGTRPTT